MAGRELDDWFVGEILPLEPVLMRFLARNWANKSELADLRQELYVRVYEAAERARPLHPKPFLFQAARNLMIDHLRRRQIVSIDTMTDLEALSVPTHEPGPEQQVGAREELKLLRQALDAVPPRAREVIWLRKVEGYSQREAAKMMGIKEGTLEAHLRAGLRYLADALADADIPTGKFGAQAHKKADEA
jgi:RNA polymerase sigma-70 factor (ECF subfamily)